jgi:carbonic anhydrase
VANLVVHSDLNCLSVLQYAVEVLRVEHVIVCGHYGCGGVEAAWKRTPFGLIDNWLRHVQDIADRHRGLFTRAMTDAQSADRLCELNVLEQASNVCRTTIVQDAWRRGQPLAVHGWIYRLRNGLIRDLGLAVSREGTLDAEYDVALKALVNAELPRETPPRSAAIGER